MKKISVTILVSFICYSLYSQNVGIGTTTPSFKLEIKSSLVEGNNNTNLLNLGGRNPVLSFQDENDIYMGYIKSITNNPIPNYSRGMEFGANPGYSIFFSNNYSPTMIIANNGNVGIGNATPAFKLDIKSSLVQYNNNTNLLSLGGLNPVLSFKDQNDIFVGYIKSITNNPIPGYSRGMEFGADPGNSIFFSTNYSPTMIVANSGNVGIGTVNPTYKLSVNGNIRSKEVVVESGWADYVFTKNYSLPSLTELKSFIQKNNHLPDIPSAKEVGEKGLELGNMQKKMMEKIEELTLYILQLKSEIDQLKSNKK